ncbi:hypothetical protein [Algirhabdus cladophorae]|uniref:hypothetical protein n=1 Tax=Algirhabdus cladophorae TaxID=3377108 RepID=UPI003B8491D4
MAPSETSLNGWSGFKSFLLVALILILAAPFFTKFENANSVSRLALVSSMIEEGTTKVDPYGHMTVDIAFHEGHYYSDKAPGMAFLSVPAYLLARAAGQAVGADLEVLPQEPSAQNGKDAALRKAAIRLMILTTSGLLTALAGLAFFKLALRMTQDTRLALLATLTPFVASPLLGWSANFFGHAATAATLFLAFYFCQKINADEKSPFLNALWAGGMLGGSVMLEYTAAPAVLIVALYGLYKASRMGGNGFAKGLGAAVIGCALPIIPVLIYHDISFGSPFSVGYSSVVGFEGMNEGFLGLTSPSVSVLYEITFGQRRGLFWISPIFILLPLGLYWAAKQRSWRSETVTSTVIVVYYLLFNASYFYWDGGASLGPRHITPALPFAGLLLVFMWMNARGLLNTLALGLLAISSFLNIAATATTLTPYRLENDYQFPIWDPVLTSVFSGNTGFTIYQNFGLPAFGVAVVWMLCCLAIVHFLWRKPH